MYNQILLPFFTMLTFMNCSLQFNRMDIQHMTDQLFTMGKNHVAISTVISFVAFYMTI